MFVFHELYLCKWHLVLAFCLMYLEVMLQYFGFMVFWGGRGEMEPGNSVFFSFLLYERLGPGVRALAEVYQRIIETAGFYFSLKIVAAVLANDFQTVYVK